MAKKQQQDSGATATAPAPEPQAATAPATPSVNQDPNPVMIGAKLFPEEFAPTQETLGPEPDTEEAPAQEPAPETDPVKEAPPAVEPPEPAQVPTAPALPEILDLSALQGKKLRVKVDGQEMEVPAEDFVKNYQLELHLNRKGQALNEQRRAIEELRKELLTKAQTQTDAVEQAVEEGEQYQYDPERAEQRGQRILERRQKPHEVSATNRP